MKGKIRPRMGAAVAVATLIMALGFASAASAASPIGADGSIHGCYVAKGKHRGSLRLLSAGKKCQKRKHEKPIVWSVQGPSGAAGSAGATGPQGPQGSPGQSGISTDQLNTLTDRINKQDATIASLNATITGLTTSINGLLTQVGTLTGVLDGITNVDLTGMRAKLNGISGAQLQSTVDALAAVTAVCSRASALTTFANDVRTAVAGIALSGLIPGGLTLTIPSLPTALSGFTCPAF